MRTSICLVTFVAACAAGFSTAFADEPVRVEKAASIDAGLEFPLPPGLRAGGEVVSFCRQIGGVDQTFSGENRYRADVILIDDFSELTELKMELIFFGIADLYFSVHKKCPGDTVYNLVDDVVVTAVGNVEPDLTPRFYTGSFDPAVPLLAGCEYAFGVAWSEAVAFSIDNRNYPTPNDGFPDGQVLGSGGRILQTLPAPDELAFTLNDNGAYFMQVCLNEKPGACCIEDTVGAPDCVELRPSDCNTAGGIFTEERLLCSDLPGEGLTCPLPLGGCCTGNMVSGFDCTNLDKFACEGPLNNGTWHAPPDICDSAIDPCAPRGACCRDDASCTTTTQDHCESALAGVYQGDGTTCADDGAACRVGACCTVDTCVNLAEASCANILGLFQGNGTACDGNICDPPGACCVGNTCEDGFDGMNAARCAAAGGTYHGDYTSCDTSAIDCDFGACCAPGSGCVDGRTRVECENVLSGSFRGEGTECVTLDPQCEGTCCWDGGCLSNKTPRDCTNLPGGSFEGYATTCGSNPCAGITPGGCCLADESCVATSSSGLCTDKFKGTFGNACDGRTCDNELQGACCLNALCIDDLLQNECGLAGGAFQGDGSVCTAELCTTGACCQSIGLDACDAAIDTLDECRTAGGNFYADRDCSICPQLGACCLTTGACENRTEGSCSAFNGQYSGAGTVCPDPAVDPTPAMCVRSACCLTNGTCVLAIEPICQTPDIFKDGIECAAAGCLPAEACCLPEGGCDDLTVAECEGPQGQGGMSQGPGTVCTDDTCTEGACCKPIPDADPVCTDLLTIAECQADGGVHKGVGVACDDGDLCTVGACCIPGASCSLRTRQDCGDRGGSHRGIGTVCSFDVCSTGACCLADGVCEPHTISACLDLEGVHQGVGTDCIPGGVCTVGACCRATGDGVCEDGVSENDCMAPDVHMGAGVLCENVDCLRGSCCRVDGTCAENVIPTQCMDEGSSFLVGEDCATAACAPAGACCEAIGGCEVVTEAWCDPATTGNTYFGDGVGCGEDPENTCPGACCFRSSSCLLTSESDCTAEFLEGQTCAGQECGGACCHADGSCEFLKDSECDGPLDVFQLGARCEEISCKPRGACCNAGACLPDQTPADCEAGGGVFLGDASTCSVGVCDRGACCHLDGTCEDGAIAQNCSGDNDVFSFFQSCLDVVCNPRAACCIVSPGGTSCQLDTETHCTQLGQTQGTTTEFAIPGTACDETACSVAACCGSVTQVCDTVARIACDRDGGIFLADLSACTNTCSADGLACATAADCNTDFCLADPSVVCGSFLDCSTAGAGNICIRTQTCDSGTCARGACCDREAGCEDDKIRRECPAEESKSFFPGYTCAGVASEDCDVKRACCLPTGECRLLTRKACLLIADAIFTSGVAECRGDLCQTGACCRSDGFCQTTLTGQSCENAGWNFQGGGSVCEPDQKCHACCTRADGGCVDTIGSVCTDEIVGAYVADMACGDAPCLGACCLPDETCQDLSAVECANQGGRFDPTGDCASACDGACCVDGRCEVTSGEAACLALAPVDSGRAVYQGDGSSCDDSICDLGGCCKPDNTCTSLVVASECDGLGEVFRPGVHCGLIDCPQRGACCVDGTCTFELEAECAGVYQGDGMTCDVDPCTLGSCCRVDGTCGDNEVASQCASADDIFRTGINCDTPCDPVGACCNAGTCTIAFEANCTAQGGLYRGDDTSCDVDTCTLGSCCRLDGSCGDDVLASQCTGAGDFFRADTACSTECGPVGACCAGGACTIEFAANCAGVYQGDGTTCDVDACTLGSCCQADGTCRDGEVASQCSGAGDFFRAGTACGTPCGPVGACCDAGACTIEFAANCAGVYQGDDMTCDVETCTIGSCCQADLTCRSDEVASQCGAAGESFRAGIDCTTPCEAACGMADLTGVVFADAAGVPADPFDQAGDCAIDARQPSEVGAGSLPQGWDRVVLSFSCDPADAGLLMGDFALSAVPVAGTVPNIAGIDIDSIANTATVRYDAPITPGQWTCLTHTPSGGRWCMGYLPANANQDPVTNASDINALINSINLVPGFILPGYATDINRTGVTNAQDITRLIDLLNGAGIYDPWLGISLPACPTAP